MKEDKKSLGANTIWIGLAVMLMAALLFLFGWNVGLVPAVLALGGHVTTINIWAAIGIVVFIRTIGVIV